MNVAIIGAGASGLVCAIEAARKGLHVSVFDKNTKVGRKILATGNGKCNISNKTLDSSRYHGTSSSFVKALLKRFDAFTCKDFFRSIGLEMREGENGRLYPMSHYASSVVDLLSHEARALGVYFFLETEVEALTHEKAQFTLHVKNERLHFDACVIATGSLAMPSLGSSGRGYAFAQALGHSVIEPYPSLVQFVSDEPHLKEASGVKVEALVELYVGGHKGASAKGDVLFTTYGISGNAVLDVSRHASKAFVEHESVYVVLDCFMQESKESLGALFQKRLTYAGDKSLLLWLEGMIPKKLALFILHYSKLNTLQLASSLDAKSIKKLVFALKALRLPITATKGFESAEICAGGVDVREVDEKTMMSKKIDKLYFTGEVLDIDGDCGGFNLHFAWGSGYIAAQALSH